MTTKDPTTFIAVLLMELLTRIEVGVGSSICFLIVVCSQSTHELIMLFV